MEETRARPKLSTKNRCFLIFGTKLIIIFRNKLASGNDTRGGNSNAAGMHVLNYHFGLEYTVMCHINRCTWGHDSCRLIREWGLQKDGVGM